MITRRQFFKLSAAVGASLALPMKFLSDVTPAYAFAQSDGLRKFVQPLRQPGADIPLAAPDAVNPSWAQPGATHYTIDIGQYTDQLHPDLPNPTRLIGFGQGGNYKHLGGIIAAKRGTPVQVTFRNLLPPDHILPIDRSIMGAEPGMDDRVNIHLHGGFVPWISDGTPHAWWQPNGNAGPSFINNQVLNPNAAPGEAEYYYPNQQSSRLIWYHDHVYGLTRLNAYAGLASAYVIYDDYELELVKKNNLPGPLDPRTVYLVFQDKVFVSKDIETIDPTWNSVVKGSRPGDLWYAHVYDPDRWELAPTDNPAADPSVIPEFFGDTMLVNGSAYPTLTVEPRQYRFRMLNACQARFLNPRLEKVKGRYFPENTEPAKNSHGPFFVQLGTEGGFLPSPVLVNAPGLKNLLLAPAERADLIVDFRDVPAGTTFLLYSDAPAPYPMGDTRTDFYPGNSDTPFSKPGFGPNTRTLMQIKVVARKGPADAPIHLPPRLTPTDPFTINQQPGKPTGIPAGYNVRRVTLNEDVDSSGRLIQNLGTDQPGNPGEDVPNFSRDYMQTPSEVISRGSREVWEIINLTGDTHPMHFHLVNVQVLSRQPFDAENYQGGAPVYTGAAYAPDNNELGWKETVRCNPGEVTRVAMTFNLPDTPGISVPNSPRLQQDYGIEGAEYVWHCHILEHEEHDMMRPLVIT